MQTQRDHVFAYQFMVNRMTSALVVGDPAAFETPARRAWTGMIIGTVLAILVAAGFFVVGLIRPGPSLAWKQRGAVLVESETGTRYVMLGGVLHPTLNQSSALLVQGREAKVVAISRASLAGLPRGAPIGIVGAPDPMPAPSQLVGGPLLLCLVDRGGGLPAALAIVAESTRLAVEPFPADRYLLVRSAAGVDYVLWHGRKHTVTDPGVLLTLGIRAGVGPVVSAAWLEMMDDGASLGSTDIAGAGMPGPEVADEPRVVGQLFEQRVGMGRQVFVLRPDGLAPLNETEFVLLAARPGAGDPVPLAAAELIAAPRSADDSLLHRLPDLLSGGPMIADGRSPCLRSGTAAPGTGLVLSSGVVATASGHDVSVVLPPGAGMLVGEYPARQGASAPDRYVITDQSRKYLVADDDSLAALGLAGVPLLPVDTRLLAGVSSGPMLSRAAARVQRKG